MSKSNKRRLVGLAIFLGLLIFVFVALSISKFLEDGLIFPSRYNSELSNEDFLFENISDFSDIHFSDLKVSDDKKVFGFYLCENQSQAFSKLCTTLQDND